MNWHLLGVMTVFVLLMALMEYVVKASGDKRNGRLDITMHIDPARSTDDENK